MKVTRNTKRNCQCKEKETKKVNKLKKVDNKCNFNNKKRYKHKCKYKKNAINAISNTKNLIANKIKRNKYN